MDFAGYQIYRCQNIYELFNEHILPFKGLCKSLLIFKRVDKFSRLLEVGEPMPPHEPRDVLDNHPDGLDDLDKHLLFGGRPQRPASTSRPMEAVVKKPSRPQTFNFGSLILAR